MSRARSTLATAVTTVLMLTAGALTVVPAYAAGSPAPAAASAQQQAQLRFPARSEIVSAGTTGFLTKGEKLLWTDLETGATTELPGTPIGNSASDVVGVTIAPNVFRLYDMASGAEPVTIDLSGRGVTYTAAGISGTTLALRVGSELHLVTDEGGTVHDRKVPGLAMASAYASTVTATRQNEFAVAYRSDKPMVATVDITTGTVTESHDAKTTSSVFASDTSVVWTEQSNEEFDLAVLDRATDTTTVTPLGTGHRAQVELIGDWALTADPRGLINAWSPDLVPLTARSLKDRTTTVRLLDHRSSAAVAPDGTLLVRGGTEEHGEGLYRISLGEHGTPIATLVAGSGESTGLGTPVSSTPETVTLGSTYGHAVFSWTLARSNVLGKLTLRHTASGLTKNAALTGAYVTEPPFRVGYSWTGLLDTASAPAGDYTWEFTATPANGIGDPVGASGSFTVTRPVAAAHDFDGNNSPDVLARDAAGRLWRDDTFFPDQEMMPAGRTLVGGGWNEYDRIEVAGNLGGSATDDLVTRDRTGGLWLYQGKGDGGFTPRTRIGSNWQIYDKITGGGDLTSDGKPDLLATDKAGGLWLYPGTGNVNVPLGDRKRIGTNWGVYNLVTATGNIAGAPPGDLLARDSSGVLWLYLGLGNGTFTPRVRVGGGWNAYTHLVPIGNADRFGYPDLLAVGPNGSYLYSSGGVWNRLFMQRRNSGLYRGETATFNEYS
ncbi:VCBS repeat-containing protein [Streptomyces sp. TX20-6-3]|uniref:VCBS repeat-containing protein n=1 Tax=Streptomyces sp. TX20-6-3 TaxID=3028705 RepID=UPI0029A2A1FC|nr:VCBS repeat-containing protein [Streptomyces sp. TX20-6-3]MDX2560073.1 VCBS repeat-containing protein [Streptomyces sp. TX20-6-3]